jgi:hypothetical protein
VKGSLAVSCSRDPELAAPSFCPNGTADAFASAWRLPRIPRELVNNIYLAATCPGANNAKFPPTVQRSNLACRGHFEEV